MRTLWDVLSGMWLVWVCDRFSEENIQILDGEDAFKKFIWIGENSLLLGLILNTLNASLLMKTEHQQSNKRWGVVT